MCILLATTKHPQYLLIILSNRDEYYKRATKKAYWRNSVGNHRSVLAPEDCAKPTRGTWIGVNAHLGKFAVVLNYHEIEQKIASNDSKYSRGKLVMDYLDENPEHSAIVHTIDDPNLQGFNFLFGDLLGKDLRIFSNRGADKQYQLLSHNDKKVTGDEGITFGVSNSSFINSSPWEKVQIGQSKLETTIEKHLNSEEELISELFDILNFNNGLIQDDFMEQEKLQKSIFIPRMKTEYFQNADFEKNPFVGNFYGTRTQTIILVKQQEDSRFTCRYIEKTLHDHADDMLDSMDKYSHVSGKVKKSMNNQTDDTSKVEDHNSRNDSIDFSKCNLIDESFDIQNIGNYN